MEEFKKYYIETITDRYVAFDGRARRKEYWFFSLFNGIIYMVIYAIFALISENASLLTSGLYSLAVLLPGLALTVRRLHDVGKSGWWYLIMLVPILGWIIIFVWTVTPGDVGDNAYGSDPKAE